MDRDEILAGVRESLSVRLGVDPDDIAENDPLDGIGDADSLDLVYFLGDLETGFRILIDDDEAEVTRTVADAVRLVERKLAALD